MKNAIIIFLFFAAVPVLGQENQIDTKKHIVESNSLDIINIGSIEINRSNNQISFPGKICLDDGPLEYLIVDLSGKTYESIIAADVDPIDLQASLLLMGLDCGNNISYQGDSIAPAGDSIEIYVSWINDNQQHRIRGEDLIWNVSSNAKMKDTKWVFSGSAFIDNQLMAKIEGSLVAVFNDPAAIINNPLPGRGDDTVYVVNKKTIPPIGTLLNIEFKVPENKGDK